MERKFTFYLGVNWVCTSFHLYLLSLFPIGIRNIFIFSCIFLSSRLSGVAKYWDNNKAFGTERHSNLLNILINSQVSKYISCPKSKSEYWFHVSETKGNATLQRPGESKHHTVIKATVWRAGCVLPWQIVWRLSFLDSVLPNCLDLEDPKFQAWCH